MRRLGWMRDPAKLPGEKPDFDAALLLGAAPIPEAASAYENVLSILDQGFHSSCVVNAGFQAIRADQWRMRYRRVVLGSRWFGYYLARAQHGATQVDGGTWVRAFFNGVTKHGFPAEDVWPYDEAIIDGHPRWAAMPSSQAFQQAVDQRITVPTFGYHRINGRGGVRVNQIKRAIAQGRLPVFGGPVNEQFCAGDFDATAPYDPSSGVLEGGHARCAAAYNARGVRCVNSWGQTWGDGGSSWDTWDYIAEVIEDIWVVDCAPPYAL